MLKIGDVIINSDYVDSVDLVWRGHEPCEAEIRCQLIRIHMSRFGTTDLLIPLHTKLGQAVAWWFGEVRIGQVIKCVRSLGPNYSNTLDLLATHNRNRHRFVSRRIAYPNGSADTEPIFIVKPVDDRSC